MRVSAQHNNARISAQKARLVADMIRGKGVAQALNILAFSPKKGAELIKKGISLAQLGIQHGLAKTTLRNAFDKRYPKGEKIIADALGKEPKDIWPSRYLD